MKEMLAELVDALRERLRIIRDDESRQEPDNHMARLQAVSNKIDALEAALPRSIDPRLRHYLQRRSYDKALEFLQGSPPVSVIKDDDHQSRGL